MVSTAGGGSAYRAGVIYRFGDYELDLARHELRAAGVVRALQPQAFSVLSYLVRHRGRAVPKRELLAELWPDAVVGEGSLQRAVSLARAAIADGGEHIRTVPRHGYRFVSPVEERAAPSAEVATPSAAFRPRFVRSGDIHVAYHTLGEGPPDIVLVPGWAFPMRAYLDHPEPRAQLTELCELGRVILFDKRGTGLSDRVKKLPTLEQRIDDLTAVLDAAGSRQAILVGASEGGPMSLLFATTYPQRARGLVLVGSFARWTAAPDHPCGWPPSAVERLRSYIERSWGEGATIAAIAASRASDPDVQAWAARAELEGASPGAALELLEMNRQIDVRPLLPLVTTPTLVLHRGDDDVIHPDNGRDLAARIPGARLVEAAGRDHMFLFEGRHHLRDAIAWVAAREITREPERLLATVVALAGPGRSELAERDDIVVHHRGLPTGQPGSWSFAGPGRAIACAHALVARLTSRGAAVRAGVHSGEVTRQAGRVTGHALEVASSIAQAAPAGAIWVSRVVRDLVHGSALGFEDAGELVTGDRTLRVLRSEPGNVTVR